MVSSLIVTNTGQRSVLIIVMLLTARGRHDNFSLTLEFASSKTYDSNLIRISQDQDKFNNMSLLSSSW